MLFGSLAGCLRDFSTHLNAHSLQLPNRSDQKMEEAMQPIKIIVEKHADGYVAYPLGLKGVVVGEGDTYGEALDDVKSAIRFHIDTFGQEVFGEQYVPRQESHEMNF